MMSGYPNYLPGFKPPTQAQEAKAEPRTRMPVFDAFQIGRKATPARVTRCGWPTDQGKKVFGGLVVLSDRPSIERIVELETTLVEQFPGTQLNSVFTKFIHDDHTNRDVPIVRVKFSKRPEALHVNEYGIVGDDQPARDPPSVMDDMRNGHLIVAMVTPKPWQRNGECGLTIYANLVNCLGYEAQGPGAYAQGLVQDGQVTWE